jgi:alpha-L-fucosidase
MYIECVNKDRRSFLRGSLQAGIVSIAAKSLQARPLSDLKNSAGLRAIAIPSAQQVAWQDMEIGMFVHFAPNTWQDVESDNLSTPLSKIDPKELNTDQWAQTAVDLGAKYIVFVAKHQGGFCMWQTKTTDYSIRNTPWKNGKGDVLAEVVASCKKFGLKLGVYVCPRDDHFGATTGGICKTPEMQKRYDAMYREQLKEVFSGYGPLVEIWFDGSTITPVKDLIEQYQPHAVIFQGPQASIRWVGNEHGFAPYPCWNGIDRADAETGVATSLNSNPNGDVWMPNEVDVSIRRPDWFWHTDNEKKVLTEEQLLSIYYRSVGRGAQLLLNIPANREGLLSGKDVSSAKTFGQELKRRFARPVAETRGNGSTVTLKLDKPSRIDTVILQEDTTKGERIREYTLEGRVAGAWRPMGNGSAIGHKRIQPVKPLTVEAIRLVVTQAAALPAIRTLAAYNTDTTPPSDWNAPAEAWASNLAGDWKDNHFSLDLTSQIKAAAQYRLHFIPTAGTVTAVQNVVLKLHGVEESKFVKPMKGQADSLLIDITGVDEKVEISGTVVGAANGQILLQKL